MKFPLFIRYTARKNISYFVMMAILAGGCKSQEPYVYVCKDGSVNIQEVPNLRHLQNTSSKDTLTTLVIRTEEQYRKYVVDRLAKIDFSKETLLAGHVRTPMPGRVVAQRVTSSCASNKLVYDVEIKVNIDGITASDQVPFFVKIPKIPESTNVTFNVHF
jgi:hypothetical protein